MTAIRLAKTADLKPLLGLYTQLTDHKTPNEMPQADQNLAALWHTILSDPNHHVIVAEQDGVAVSTCVLIIVPNLTHGQHPYALIENVVTHEAYRKQGLACAVLAYAKDIAKQRGCYKIMLMTGSKLESTLRFYEKAGYNCQDKTAFIQWLE